MKLRLMLCALAFASASAQAYDLGDFLGIKPPKNGSGQAQPAEPKTPAFNLDTLTTVLGARAPGEEARVGRQIAGDLLGAAPLVPNAKLQAYVNDVGRWVALQSGDNAVNWRFGVLDTPDINAFSAPGGYVFITLGLYRMLDNEAELAGVLGHEIAHVSQRDHMKILQQSALISALSQAMGRQVQGSDQAVQNLLGNGAEIMARKLDKDAEFRADRLGVVYAARAGYDPWGLPLVLQKLAALPHNDNRMALLFKTHPSPAERLDALSAAIGSRFDDLGGRDLANQFYRVQ